MVKVPQGHHKALGHPLLAQKGSLGLFLSRDGHFPTKTGSLSIPTQHGYPRSCPLEPW